MLSRQLWSVAARLKTAMMTDTDGILFLLHSHWSLRIRVPGATPAIYLQTDVCRGEHLLDGDLLHAAIVVGTDVEQAGVAFHRSLQHQMLTAVGIPSAA